MSRRPALVTQADVTRVLRAIQSCGYAGVVEVKTDGSIRVLPLSAAGITGIKGEHEVDEDEIIPL